jgi:uncharacterized membrane protein
MSTDALVRRDRDPSSAPVRIGVAIGWTLAALGAAALLQLVVYRNGGREALADVPGRFFAWRLGGHAFPYLDRGVEYPVVIGYLAYALASVMGTATRFFVANGVIDVGLAVAMTCLLRVRGGARIWRWIVAPPLVLFAFHNWDLLALVPAIIGLYAYLDHNDRMAGASLAFGASTKLFPGLFLVPLAVMRWCAGDRRGAARLLAWAAGVLVVLNGPVLLLSRSGWWYPAAFQGRRRATWGTLWFWLFRLPGASHVTHHDPVQLANLLAVVALVVSIATITALGVRRHVDALAIGAATTAAFLLTNKVYSPNYDLWIVPFFVLLPLARSHWLTFAAADIGIFTLVYGQFHGLWGHHVVRETLPLFVAVRALTLVLLIVVALRPERVGRDDRAPADEITPHAHASGAGERMAISRVPTRFPAADAPSLGP